MVRLGFLKEASDVRPLLKVKQVFRHIYILGKTQTGKSTLMLNLARQFSEYGAVIVLDPSGSVADKLANIVPRERLAYVSQQRPLVINPLQAKMDRSQIANNLIEVVNNCVTGTTPSIEITTLMGEIIRNAINVLKDDELTIDKLSALLNFENIREKYRDDPYWKVFDQKDAKGWYVYREKRESAQRVASRLSAFCLDESLRKFTIGKNQFNVSEFVRDKKIVCFNFHGFDNDLMLYLGNMAMVACKNYYMREATTESQPLFILVDEFHLFMSPAFNNMLAECAKYNVGLVLSHHTFRQLTERTLNVAVGNCFTKIIFNSGYEEADYMANEMQIKPKDILGLKPYEARAQIGNKCLLIKMKKPPNVSDYRPYDFLREEWIEVC